MALLVAAASATRPPEPEPGPCPESTCPAGVAAALYDYEASFDDPELWALLQEGGRTLAAAESPKQQAPDARGGVIGFEAGAAAAPQDESSASASQPREGGGAGARWTTAEDEALRAAVAELGAKSWKLVAARLQSRSDVQCLHRWMKVLRPGLKKGAWTAEEDAALKAAVAAAGGPGEGKVDWSRIAAQLPGRLGKQCRERWENHLRPDLRFGEWMPEEDALILDWHARVGGRWTKIAQHLPRRTQNAIKNRYNSALKRRGAAADGGKEGEGKDDAPAPNRRRRKEADGRGFNGSGPAAMAAAAAEGQQGLTVPEPLLDSLQIQVVDQVEGSALLFVGHEGDGRPGHEGPMEVIDVWKVDVNNE